MTSDDPTVAPSDGVDSDEGKKQEASVTRGWLKGPASLKESALPTWQQFLLSSSLILIPAPFIVYMISLHQQPESQLGTRVLEAANIAATLWPIAFAAVLGTTLRSVALYACERGTTLGTLEILMGSVTMTSTLKLLVWVRLVSFWSPILILAWTLSPLGGQSVLRAIAIKAEILQHDFPIVSYPSIRTEGWEWLPLSTGPEFGLRTVFGAAFSSSSTRLMHANGSSPNFSDTLDQVGGADEARRISQQDPWGNARIPFLHMLEGYDSENPHAWVDVPDNSVPPYESLIGVPIRGIPAVREGNATVTIQTSYMSLSCGPVIEGMSWIEENLSRMVLAGVEEKLGNIHLNYTNWSFFSASRGADRPFHDESIIPPIQFDLLEDRYTNRNVSYEGDFNLTAGRDRPLKQTLLFIADGSPIGTRYSFWNMTMCALSTSYVDAVINCSRPSENGFLSCSTNRVRHTKGLPIKANTTVFSAFDSNKYLLSLLPWLLPDPEGSQNNLVNLFIRDPTKARPLGKFHRYDSLTLPLSLETLPTSVLEARLAVILNTAARASFEQSIIVGADDTSPSSMPYVDDNALGMMVTPLADWGNSTGTWTEFTEPKYKVNWAWMGIYGMSSLVMVVFTITHVALQYKIRTPDIFNSVSSLTRDSPYVVVPDGGSTLDGIERIRLLKNERVRIGDVQPHSETGKIAFNNLISTSLELERTYE
ncbi:hypothetical protein FLONG3_6860 [Fusarium longipes]|uniref:Uncharacterized protein n=1 Tax=Fusarium longipes TaxID=694270 RepID=A0A395SJ63_9HYPO|nr:hypothetical protein FLONG3_6860 [Fusarium longipes]